MVQESASRAGRPAALTGTWFESGPATVAPEQIGEAVLQRGGTLSRYLLIERVGVGGMGVVWAAYDPELDRKIAIKLLRPRRTEGKSEEARARLVREAQAMARLSHPNVIAVHDVGEHAGQVFVAMEFVEGRTLSRWIRAGKVRRTWREIVAMFVQAGRGLAEAHRAGLVHRDFKPDNVLIGSGRAKVTDFGLARSVETETLENEDGDLATTAETAAALGAETNPALVTALTRTGAMLGTPAYMAPEQFASGQFDARSDQFAFCVALWEALYGQRPFSGRTIDELGEQVMAGRISDPPGEIKFPSFIEQALRRGLSVDPAQRWPSMDALLEELQRDPSRGRRRWLIGGGLVASFAAAVVLTPFLQDPEAGPVDPCPDPSAQLDGVWDGPRRAALHQAMVAAGVAEPERVAASLAAALDGYAASWLAMREDACEATHVRHEQSESLLDLRVQCLDRARVELGAKVALLTSGELGAEELAAGASLLAGLAPVEPCGRPAYLEATTPIPADPQLARVVAEQRERLAWAKARVDAGTVEAAIPALEELLEAAETFDYLPLRAEILTELGFASGGLGDAAQTRELLERAVVESLRSGQDHNAARAGIELGYVVGVRLGQPEEGLRWAARVDAWHDRLDASPLSRAQLRVSEASVLLSRGADGDLARARQRLHEGLTLLGLDSSLVDLDRLGPGQSVCAGWILGGLATVAQGEGDYDRARELALATHDLQVRIFGPHHERTDWAALRLAVLDFERGDWAGAHALLEELAPFMAAHRDSPAGDALTWLLRLRIAHEVAVLRGDRASQSAIAATLAQRRPALEAGFERNHWNGVRLLVFAASVARERGRLEDAARELEAAGTLLDELDAAVPSLARHLALERAFRAIADGSPAQLEAAVTGLDALLAELRAATSANPRIEAMAIGLRGRAHLGLGRRDEAIADLEASLARWGADGEPPREIHPWVAGGHPEAITILEALAELDEARAPILRERAARLRAGLPEIEFD